MGNYINANLTKEEHVVYEAHYHWSIWIGSLIGASFFFVPMLNLLIEANNQDMSPAPITWVLMIIGFLILFFTYLKVVTDEFAITNQRLIIKTGVISRDTLELNLTKVETISVSRVCSEDCLALAQLASEEQVHPSALFHVLPNLLNLGAFFSRL